MGKYLRSLKAFSLHADTAIDEVLTTGQKIQFAGSLDYTVEFPNRLRAEVRSDRRTRDYIFDGKTLTQYSPRMNYYATVSAPGTLTELVQVANQKYGLPLPLADLFLWGTDKGGVDDITSAAYFGPARIGGKDCGHYAYRQSDVDWQIWIERGAHPLPCKIVITNHGRTVAAAVRGSSEMEHCAEAAVLDVRVHAAQGCEADRDGDGPGSQELKRGNQ